MMKRIPEPSTILCRIMGLIGSRCIIAEFPFCFPKVNSFVMPCITLIRQNQNFSLPTLMHKAATVTAARNVIKVRIMETHARVTSCTLSSFHASSEILTFAECSRSCIHTHPKKGDCKDHSQIALREAYSKYLLVTCIEFEHHGCSWGEIFLTYFNVS